MKRLKFQTAEGLWWTSDHHYGHGSIIKYANRPFTSVEEMDAEMIRRWNAVVAPTDTVFHIGDFSFKKGRKATEAILAQLHGTKHLIVGNHDHSDTCKAKGWASVERYREITVGEQPLVLCHYPFETWNASHYGTWMLHGHCHGSLKPDLTKRRVDVGVDCWDFAPVDLATIATQMAKVTFEPVDHHRERREP